MRGGRKGHLTSCPPTLHPLCQLRPAPLLISYNMPKGHVHGARSSREILFHRWSGPGPWCPSLARAEAAQSSPELGPSRQGPHFRPGPEVPETLPEAAALPDSLSTSDLSTNLGSYMTKNTLWNIVRITVCHSDRWRWMGYTGTTRALAPVFSPSTQPPSIPIQ